MSYHLKPWFSRSFSILAACFVLSLATTTEVRSQESAKADTAIGNRAPANVAELRKLEKSVRGLMDKIIPATVGVRIGGGSGSGVIVSKDGYVMTAGPR